MAAAALREFLIKVGDGREETYVILRVIWNSLFLRYALVRFIDEVVAILRDNQVVGMKYLHKFKFEYVAWPEKVSGTR